MRMVTTSGQSPDAVVAACVNQVRRALKRPETRRVIMEALRPYTRGTGHSDMNGDRIAKAIFKMVQALTFYREPAGEMYPGEVV